MQKKITRLTVTLCLTIVLATSGTADVFASTVGQLQDAEKEKERAEDKIDSTQDDIDALSDEKAELQAYLDQLNSELLHASGELIGIEDLIAEKEQKLVDMQKELEEAKERAATQKVAMARRIKFMYERGDSAYLQLFFESDSFADFLNKNEYVERVSQYDRKMLEEYVTLQDLIQSNEQSLVDERVALEVLQKQALDKKNEVAGLVTIASKDVAEFEDQISAKEQELMEYEEQLRESENDIAQLRQKLQEEQALTKLAMQNGFTDLSDITFAAGDLDLMAAIIYCEAGNQPYTGQVAVGNVVMNRVKSSVFPNTILEVLYQNRQFSPVGSGRFALALANKKATPACYQAAQDAMAGSAPVGNCLFFRTPIPGLTGIQIGGHIFY